MDAGESVGRGPTFLRAAFALLALLVLAAIGYAFWIVLRYWETISV